MNRMNRALGTRYPVCSAGMAMVAGPELTAAVSAAGGLGILGSGPAPLPWLEASIRQVRAATQAPFAINLINETTSFGPLTTDDHVELCIREGVDAVVFFWQLPEPAWVAALRDAGIPLWATAGDLDTLEEAMRLAVDGVVLQGTEAGGHVRSDAGVLDLVAQARRRHADALLVAAGGIATSADVQRALDHGADGVCLGTRFVACREADAHPDYQARIVRARARDTVITRLFGPEWPDVPMRVIRNGVVDGSAPRRTVGTTQLFGQTYDMPYASAVLPTRATNGDLDAMCLAAGESVDGIHAIMSAGEIVQSLFADWWHDD